MKEKVLWEAVLAQIELSASPASFATWFKNTEIVSMGEEKIIVSVPNSFAKEWLEKKYQDKILKILHSLGADAKKIDFIVTKPTVKTKDIIELTEDDTEQLEFEVFRKNRPTGLNPRYTFENFVVGGFNELAHAAAIAIAKKPGVLYNPLFIYGPVGIGKTHLIQATGNEAVKNTKNTLIRYIPAERLISEIIASIRNGQIEKLKNEYREADVLIVDDVQFLAGKEKTQEEFFHIFNALYQKNKQIILSSDRSPKAIPSLAQRLRSRFEGGMIADIGYPDLETRIAILKNKAKEKDANLPDDVYNLIASGIQTNIRELEGALNSIIMKQKVGKESLMDKAKAVIKEITYSPQKKLTPKKIIQSVAEFYGIKEDDILSSTRRKEIVKPRQMAMYFLRTKIQASYPFIARKFGGKDHTTAMYACRKILENMAKDGELKEDVEVIKMRLANL